MIVGLIVLTLGVAGVATYLINVFSTPDKVEELEEKAKPIVHRVLIAKQDLKTGTPVTEDSVAWQVWAEEALNKDFVSVDKDEKEAEALKKVVGTIVRRAMHKGEPVIAAKLFKKDKPGYLAGMLDPGMRAVSVPVTQITGAAGFIFPGDHVDVMLTHDKIREVIQKRIPKPKQNKMQLTVLSTATETILRNVRVIAIAQQVDEFDKKALIVPTVTLEVTPKQAQFVTTARAMGSLSLALRSLEGNETEKEPRGYSTDVEVSPFMKNFDKIIGKLLPPPKPKGPSKAEKERDELKSEVEILRQDLDEARAAAENSSNNVGRVRTAPLKKSKRVTKKTKADPIIIYRGGSRQSEKVQAK